MSMMNSSSSVEEVPDKTLISFEINNRRIISEKQEDSIFKMFNILKKNELNYIFYSNIYSNFVPNWRELKEMHSKIDNIFNNYTKISKLFKTIKNKGKVKDNNRRNVKLI